MIAYDLLGLAQTQALFDELGSLSLPDPIMLNEEKRALLVRHCARPDPQGGLSWNWWWYDVSNVLRLDDGSVKVTFVAQDLYATDKVAVLAKNPNSDGTEILIESLGLALESLQRYAIAVRDGQTLGRVIARSYAQAGSAQVESVVRMIRSGKVDKATIVYILSNELMAYTWDDNQAVLIPSSEPLCLAVDSQQTYPDGRSITLRGINRYKHEEASRFEASWTQLERTLLSHVFDEVPPKSGNWIAKARRFP